MQHALFNKRLFDKNIKNPSYKNRKAAHIYKVTDEKTAQSSFVLGMYEGNKHAIDGARDVGVIAGKLTDEKLTYEQILYLDLGHTADEITHKLQVLKESDVRKRLDDIALLWQS